MKLQQISVFLENRPGTLSAPCKALGEAGINILTLSLADTKQFGILRLIVRDVDRAKQVLEDAGCVVNLTDVVAIQVADKPGGLAAVLHLMEAAEINIEYMYPFNVRRGRDAAIVLRFGEPEKAIELLSANGYDVVGTGEFDE